jgi:two-component system invasion response regulator UvrY
MKVIVCDDHPVVRAGLTHIMLAGLTGASVREAGSGRALLDLLRGEPAEVVLLDIGLPDQGGLQVLRQIKDAHPRLPVLMLSVHPGEQYALRALRAGASGYLTKDLATTELVDAVKTVASGRRYLTPDVADRLADGLVQGGDALHDSLSDREFEVMTLLASGRSVKEAAGQLGVTYNTANTYRARILIKLALRSNADLTRYALQHELID